MKLYTLPGTCSVSIHIALEWYRVSYELGILARGDNTTPAYLTVNPHGKVPSLVLDDGSVLTEAAAILCWLAETRELAGETKRAAEFLARFRLAEMLAYLSSEVHGAFGPLFNPSRYGGDPALHGLVTRAATVQIGVHMSRLDGMLSDRDSIIESGRSVADSYLYVMTRWLEDTEAGIAPYRNLSRFRARMEEDAGVSAALLTEGMHKLGSGMALPP